ncbi:hypothetical protein SAMN06265337_3963 [Hymenobacter gelipurpurascens]|uniref:Lipoprotein n=1 Tax=Hymenobacter gelipurpurascens TaxID=89968 RepID=A0A212UGT0_9BACT|nr:hypothetical protein [Hymenobacter gelipurpurascens]SNC77380.1 hypothetical protein SAMN06265337_3963 [Hymenobacter gelipurpurascens]
MRQRCTIGLLVFLLVSCSEKQESSTAALPPTNARPGANAADATAASRPEIKPQAVPLAQIPAPQRLPGQLLEAWRWQDANGENLLVVFRAVTLSNQQRAKQAHPATAPDSNEVEEMGDFERTARLMAKQYVLKQGKYTVLWRLQDGVAACALDMTLGLKPSSTTITDLDQDGQGETTLVYTAACRGDVSPASLKLIMREGPDKYALRGSTVVQYDSVPVLQRQPAVPCCAEKLSKAQREQGDDAGYYETEKEFQRAPPAFLSFARQQWQKFSIEKVEDHTEI